MIFAMASPRNTKKRWTAMDSADSFLPFQDWRWLVTRHGADEKPMIARCRKVLGFVREDANG
ncbi:hypothetical protein [Mesorhizobium waimense]|uniref:hypothetical protein n=1 Tax=Mesorhizobium waimense TaxID=1300307 RepID=UPI0011C465C5|nr:hypothetical protein [Mesorhizobium waimense]